MPTDCPQRDERLGWVNDMTARYENAIYNFDCVLAYEKWMQDLLLDSQAEDGAIPDTAPITSADALDPTSPVFSCCCLGACTPFTNDRQILEILRTHEKIRAVQTEGEGRRKGFCPTVTSVNGLRP